MQLARIAVSVEGVTPLLCNRFGFEAATDASEGTRSVAAGHNDSPREQAFRTLYLDNDNETPIIPSTNLFRSQMDAGRDFKIGKRQVTTLKTSMWPAFVTIPEIVLPIIHEEPWDVDTRPVRIPATGGRILRHRACFNDWKLNFTLEIDASQMNLKLARQIIDAAGTRIGLGDFRPSFKGSFGKYVVTHWEEYDQEQEG